MSTFDYQLFSRPADLSLQPGSLPPGSLPPGSLNPGAATPAGSTSNPVPLSAGPLNAPLTDVAKLHTAAERSMSTGLPSAVARAVDFPAAKNDSSAVPKPPSSGSSTELHRIREVRREQGVSIKRASQHLGVTVDEARRLEEPTTDLTLSQLFAWQKLCEVPVADLLVEPDCDLSAPILQRARMVRVMKTVQAILERTGQQSVKRLGQTLVNQLVELMPELKNVSSWHAVERRQSCNQNARILESNYLRPEEADPREP